MAAAPSTFTQGFIVRDYVIFHDNLLVLYVIFIYGNSIHKPPASFSFGSTIRDHAVTVEPIQFLSRQGGVAYEWSYNRFDKIANLLMT
jgi:hypothetical protein